jgi:FKBP-type peptidyl-prolyl cis-trans isomerase (trigger factor)
LRDKSLAGKKAVFDVTVKESNIRSVPEINDELAEKIRPGLDAEGLIQEVCRSCFFS